MTVKTGNKIYDGLYRLAIAVGVFFVFKWTKKMLGFETTIAWFLSITYATAELAIDKLNDLLEAHNED